MRRRADVYSVAFYINVNIMSRKKGVPGEERATVAGDDRSVSPLAERSELKD